MLSKKQAGVIAILLGLSLAIGWFDGQLFRSLPNHEKQNGSDHRPNAKPAEIRPDERIADYTWWLAVLTGALVAVSLGQGFFLLRSDKTARITASAALKSAETAEKDLLASHRPLVTITDLKLCEPPHQDYGVSFGLRNSGKGFVAVNKIGVTIQTIDSNQKQLMRFVSADWNGALEAGDGQGGNFISTEILGKSEHYLVINGRLALFVNFEVLSKDIFLNEIRQRFFFVYNPRASHFERAPSRWDQNAKGQADQNGER